MQYAECSNPQPSDGQWAAGSPNPQRPTELGLGAAGAQGLRAQESEAPPGPLALGVPGVAVAAAVYDAPPSQLN